MKIDKERFQQFAVKLTIKSLLLALICSFALPDDLMARPKYEYTNVSRTCHVDISFPPSIGWETEKTCTQTGAAAAEPFDFKVAVNAPAAWGAPTTVRITKTNGDDLVINGVLVTLVESTENAEEAENLHPSDPGFAWSGYTTSKEIPSTAGDGSVTFKIYYEWVFDQVTDDEGGADWFSDTNDDLYGHEVIDVYTVFPAP